MKPGRFVSRTIAAVAVAAVALFVAVFAGGGRVGAAPGEGQPSSCDPKLTGVIAPVIMPVQFGGAQDPQFEVGCNAIQEFTYLNWRARGRGIPDYRIGPSAFGSPVGPNATYSTVWESYVNPDDLFKTPTALKNARYSSSNGVRTLSAISKADGDDVRLTGFHQADFGWLTARTGDLTFYEVRIDNDEADYITRNGLTSAVKQQQCAATGGLSLPDGTKNDHDCRGNAAKYGLNIGAIELKAAWIELHDPAKYSRYLLSRANLVYPDGKVRLNAVIGLVGLHIIRKMGPLQQLSWATFEHVDNDPDATPYPAAPATAAPEASPTATPAWTYRNPACTGPYCTVNKYPTPCATGNPPGCQRYSYPTQTERVTPQSSFAASNTTTFRRALLKAGATGSVFRYYRLIDVQWPAGSTRIPPGARIPLTEGSPLPRWIVANTTMETYEQSSAACLDCHSSARAARGRAPGARVLVEAIAPAAFKTLMSGPSPTPSPYAADYSFVFGKAK
jgi:hypothetical protein